MKIIEEALNPISGCLASIIRNTKEGWYEFEIGIPNNWVFDDNDKINEIHMSGYLINDETLENERQCLIERHLKHISPVKYPVQLNEYILAYAKIIMNK